MGQRGFWDEEQRVTKLQDKKPVLKRLADSIPWELFRPILDQGYVQDRKSNAGFKRIDPLTLFKILVLHQLFNLSDDELEFQVNDRRSFEEFIGLGVMNSIPDAITVAFFTERLRKAGVIDEVPVVVSVDERGDPLTGLLFGGKWLAGISRSILHCAEQGFGLEVVV